MYTCDDCGLPFDYGGSTDGRLTICNRCATLAGDDGELEELDFSGEIKKRRGRRRFYGGGR